MDAMIKLIVGTIVILTGIALIFLIYQAYTEAVRLGLLNILLGVFVFLVCAYIVGWVVTGFLGWD